METKTTEEPFPLKVAEPTADWHLPNERELIQSGPKDGLHYRVIAWVFILTGFAFFVVSRRTVSSEFTFAVVLSEAVVLLAVSQALLAYLYRRQSNFIDVGSGFRRLRSKVPDHADLPVNVEIIREGCLTGRDSGYIWLDEGTWYFKGLQTAFRFNQQDVVPIEAWPKSIAPDPTRDKPPETIPMKSKLGPLTIRVRVIDPHEDFAKRKRARKFYRELYDWLAERPRGAIESLLPPRAVHPSLKRRGLWKYEGLVAAVGMVAIDTGVMSGLPRDGGATSAGNFGMLSAIVVSCD